jgi:MoxR-like ATPase
MNVQTLKCQNCGSEWTRTATRGRPPAYCDACRRLGPTLGKRVEVERPAEAGVIKPGKHYAFATLLAVATARIPAMLVGPAGSGKTTAGRQVAETLGLSFTSESCNPQMTKWDVMGFVGPNGNYVPGVMREAFEHGGVVLLDEMDASNPAVLVSINMLASVSVGETVTFPDGADVPRHPDFILIAGANTFGDGASGEYVGREQLDAATLDRFACVEWGYDETLERALAGADAQEWVTFVQAVRAAAKATRAPMLVTPRATINGAALIRGGMSRKVAADLTVWKGVSRDVRRMVEGAVKAAGAAA